MGNTRKVTQNLENKKSGKSRNFTAKLSSIYIGPQSHTVEFALLFIRWCTGRHERLLGLQQFSSKPELPREKRVAVVPRDVSGLLRVCL